MRQKSGVSQGDYTRGIYLFRQKWCLVPGGIIHEGVMHAAPHDNTYYCCRLFTMKISARSLVSFVFDFNHVQIFVSATENTLTVSLGNTLDSQKTEFLVFFCPFIRGERWVGISSPSDTIFWGNPLKRLKSLKCFFYPKNLWMILFSRFPQNLALFALSEVGQTSECLVFKFSQGRQPADFALSRIFHKLPGVELYPKLKHPTFPLNFRGEQT